ncbi:MAG: hypothetical protein KUL87_18535 [Pseudomonas sp.]|nr:hypothetical protein [Pseudomonas sp.]
MKIVAGSFGVKGSAYIAKNAILAVEGARNVDYRPRQIKSVEARVDADKRFGWGGAIVGGILLFALGMFFAGLFGALIGVILAVAGSFYSTKRNMAEVEFEDGARVTLECTPRAMDRLVKFAAQR